MFTLNLSNGLVGVAPFICGVVIMLLLRFEIFICRDVGMAYLCELWSHGWVPGCHGGLI